MEANKPLEAGEDLPKLANDELVDVCQLPKAKGWLRFGATLYQGCWFPSNVAPNVIKFQKEFESHDQDIILASHPKSGTTWLKSLLFSILNRNNYKPSDTPLLTSNPHKLVSSFEFSVYAPSQDKHREDVILAPAPRLISTHIPYASLCESIKRSESKIVYICRNPLDTITSFWHFAARGHPSCHSHWTMEECVETFCKGQSHFGPFWDHVLGYWKESLERPEKVLFLKYEDMKEDTVSQVKRLAEFVGFPFSEEEESSGVAEQMLELCSLSNLKELGVNKHGQILPNFHNKLFFRKGEVGDWANHLSASMVERVDEVIQENLRGSGLSFKVSS